MLKKIFLFSDVTAFEAKVSHCGFIGLPSLTGLTGLGTIFVHNLAKSLNLNYGDLIATGVLTAFNKYELIEGYKSQFKVEGRTSSKRTIPELYANIEFCFAIEIQATTASAEVMLNSEKLKNQSLQIFKQLNLCSGKFKSVKNLDIVSERDNVLDKLNPWSKLIVDESGLVSEMRNFIENKKPHFELSLQEGLVQAMLTPKERTEHWAEFFNKIEEDYGESYYDLVPVQNGYFKLTDNFKGIATRENFKGERLPTEIVSATTSLVRLRSTGKYKKESKLDSGYDASRLFFTLKSDENKNFKSYFCTTH